MGQSRRCSPVQAPDRRVGGRSVNDFQLTGAARSAARRTQAMVPEGAECSPSIRIAFRRVEPCPPHWRQLPQPEPAPPVASAPARRLLRRVSAQDRGGRQRPRRLGACQVSRAKSDVCAQNIRYAGGRGAERPDLEPHVTSINNMRAKSRVVSGRCETWQPCPGPASRRWKVAASPYGWPESLWSHP